MMRTVIILLLVTSYSLSALANTTAILRLSVQNAPESISFQQEGTGLRRFEDNRMAISQALLDITSVPVGDWQFHSVINAYSDGEQRIGFSQLFAEYRPLSPSSVKSSARIGFFYPRLSVENTDKGWLSSHFLNNSAINAWVGEELRVPGVEWTWRRPGRAARSPWSWEMSIAAYKGNDTTGTLLSWRGFAFHDRQSLHDDRVWFAPLPGVISPMGINAPNWTDPFREIDGKWGLYAGAHLRYLRQTEWRYYYYDNRADPLAVDPDRIYAWHTRFHSLAFRHQLTPSLTLLSQFMSGNTLMGPDVVSNDFHSAYLALVKTSGETTFSTRADWYQVVDKDSFTYDPNASQGTAITVNVTRQLTPNVALSGEWLYHISESATRPTVGQSAEQRDNQLQLAITLRY